MIHGNPPGGLQDTTGRFIDGDNNGQAGGDGLFVIRRNGVSRANVVLSPSSRDAMPQAVAAGIVPDQVQVVGVTPFGTESSHLKRSRST
jgi:hypothetical protein